jgi:hypothetical protein
MAMTTVTIMRHDHDHAHHHHGNPDELDVVMPSGEVARRGGPRRGP